MSEPGENRASDRLSLDEPRLLARGVGYTRSFTAAMYHEPEAVSADTQADITRQAHERVEDARRHELRMQAERAERSRAHYAAQLKHAERQLARLRTQLAAG